MPVVFKSRIPRIMVELPAAVDAAVATAAKLVEGRAKARVPVNTGRLRDAIHVERGGLAEYEVKGGDNEAWYGHLVEHGTTYTPPRPFMVPSAEESRAEATALVAAAVRRVT